MKFPDALLLGSVLLKPKCGVFDNDGDGCALGMANRAIGGGAADFRVEKTWPWLNTTRVQTLPCTCKGTGLMGAGGEKWFTESETKESVWATIVHLFNQHVCDGSWTIEQLADWVRSVEPAEPEVQADQLEALRIEEYDARSGSRG